MCVTLFQSMSVCLSVCLSVTRLSGGALSANSSETAWNFQTPFYRMGTGSLRMVYVIFHKSICHRDFTGRGGVGGCCGGGALSPNSSETAWNFQTPFYRMNTDSLRMVYVNFHRPICHRDFSMTVLFQGIFWNFHFWPQAKYQHIY